MILFSEMKEGKKSEEKVRRKREEGRKDRRKELKIWRIFGKSSIFKEHSVEILIFSVLEIILVLGLNKMIN